MKGKEYVLLEITKPYNPYGQGSLAQKPKNCKLYTTVDVEVYTSPCPNKLN